MELDNSFKEVSWWWLRKCLSLTLVSRFIGFSVCGPGCCQGAHGWDGRLLKVSKSLVVVGGGWLKVIIVSVHVRYFSFFSLCQTGYVRLCRLHQVTSVYVGGTGRRARQYESYVKVINCSDSGSIFIHFNKSKIS